MAQQLCENCKQPFTPSKRQSKAQQDQQRFCSPTCRNQAIPRRPMTKGQACLMCGKVGYDRRGVLCRECQSKATEEQRTALGLTSFRHVWTDEEIAYLQEHYPSQGGQAVAEVLGVKPSSVIAKANSLGVRLNKQATRRIVHAQARSYMRQSNPMKSAEVVEKVKKWRDENPEKVNAIRERLLEGQQQLQRNKPSKLEKRLHVILDGLGVAYEPSAYIKPNFIVDIRIGMLILQADGEYWHGHPRFAPLTERQQRQQARDRAQDTYLHACGYTVVRIWDRDITPDNIAAILRRHRVLPPT